jgi:hypothetical protein
MNVLILTPDRVGSTLLQRLITIYMQFHAFDQPVINLHELTNGIMRYWSPVFNTEVLGKGNEKQHWGYHQSLPEISELLASVPHYKTSRLALYHIKNRNDSIEHQVPFYQYLNDNFFIISARRENLLEHALSWCIFVDSKQLNVYSHEEKFKVFGDIYRHGVVVEKPNLHKYLDAYRDYLDWTDRHFHVNSYFDYDYHMQDLEKYILGLPIFRNQTQCLCWQDKFDVPFQDWNRCHYLCSDLSALGSKLALSLDGSTSNSDALVPVDTQREAIAALTVKDQQFLRDVAPRYIRSQKAIDELVENKILVTGVPIKLQTMMEKQRIIRNFDQVVTWYNEWVDNHGLGTRYTGQDLDRQADQEIRRFHDMGLLGYCGDHS